MNLTRISALGLVAVTLAGCITLGPDYHRPEVKVPEAFSGGAAPGEIPDAWWSLFGDPQLDKLEEEALAANQDLAAAVARVEESRALVGVSNADRFPRLDAGLSGSRSQLSHQTAQVPPGIPLEFDRFRLAGTLSYELDFWGRLARATEAARADLVASEEGRRNVRLAVTADVAGAYLDLLAFDRQLAITRETLGTRTESVRLQRLRFDAGSISELDLAQAEAELAAAESTVPQLERAVRRTEDRLGVLLGRIGGSIEHGDRLDALTLPETPVGMPSDLLARRPDVVAAEQALVAANARIGIAKAELFPSINLTGYYGSESKELSDLVSSGTTIWQAALGLVQPIFNAGKGRRNLEATRARQRQALAGYTKAIQSAFAEVEDALVGRTTGAAEREAVARQVAALEKARRLAQLRYDAGDASYLEVLDAERSLFIAELEWVRARRDELGAAVGLVRALGGGWGGPAADGANGAGQATKSSGAGVK